MKYTCEYCGEIIENSWDGYVVMLPTKCNNGCGGTYYFCDIQCLTHWVVRRME